MDWNRLKPWLGTLARLVLGVAFVWASWSKLHSPRDFLLSVRAYDATPDWLTKTIAYGLPVLELALGVLLVAGAITRIAAAVGAFLLLVFLIGLVQAAARGIELECGCFSTGGATVGGTSYTLDILRDIVLLAVAVYLVVWPFTRLSFDEFLQRHDYVEPPSAKRMRTTEGRRKYESAVAAKQREARSRALWVNGSATVIVALIALIGLGVQANRAKITGSVVSTNASPTNGVVYGIKAAATVDVYEDFQCPHCLEFEKSAATTLDADVVANRAQVRFHPIAILDASSNGNDYSTRAANAAICASDVSVLDFVKYHNLLFGTYKGKQVQPAEDSDGRTDGDFLNYATQIGLSKAQLSTFQDCVRGQTYKGVVEAITERASQHGIDATPTVLVNGKSVNATLPALKAAIAAADAKGPAPTPSKTLTPSKSPSSPASTSPSPSTSTSPSKSPSTSKSASTSPSKSASKSPSKSPSTSKTASKSPSTSASTPPSKKTSTSPSTKASTSAAG